MEISQPVMTSVPNTLVSHRMKQWQWKYHLINSVFVRKPMDNFAISLPLFNCWQTHHPVSQLYMPKMHLAFLPDVHCKSGKLKASVYPNKLYPMYGY